MIIEDHYTWPQFSKDWGEWKPQLGDIVSAIAFKDRTRVRVWLDRKKRFYLLTVEIERKDPKFKKWVGKRRTRTR